MVDGPTVALVIAGLLLLFVGATVSSYAATVLGMLIGGTGGYLIGPTIANIAGLAPDLATTIAVVMAAIAGAVLTVMLLKTAIASLAFVVGTYAGWSALAGLLVDSAILEIPVAIGIGLAAAAIGFVMTKTMLVILTSFLGAALASMSVTATDMLTAQSNLEVRPLLFDVADPIFVGLFALGVLTQLGLFKLGYTTKLLAILPGVRAVHNRGEGQ